MTQGVTQGGHHNNLHQPTLLNWVSQTWFTACLWHPGMVQVICGNLSDLLGLQCKVFVQENNGPIFYFDHWFFREICWNLIFVQQRESNTSTLGNVAASPCLFMGKKSFELFSKEPSKGSSRHPICSKRTWSPCRENTFLPKTWWRWLMKHEFKIPVYRKHTESNNSCRTAHESTMSWWLKLQIKIVKGVDKACLKRLGKVRLSHQNDKISSIVELLLFSMTIKYVISKAF